MAPSSTTEADDRIAAAISVVADDDDGIRFATARSHVATRRGRLTRRRRLWDGVRGTAYEIGRVRSAPEATEGQKVHNRRTEPDNGAGERARPLI